MRSRPKLQLFLTPNPPLPGAPVVAELRVQSRSETPVDAITLRLEGHERRLRGMTMAGHVPVANYALHTHVSLVAKKSKRVLPVGEHVVRVQFDLPADAPPAYASPTAEIEYELSVHVDIPWWPDRRERYLVKVGVPPTPPGQARPTTFCNVEGGPRGKHLYLEASVDRPRVVVGEVLTGAVSITNADYHRIKRVELSFVAIERPIVGAPEETARFAFTLVDDDRKLVDGAPIPFRLRFPAQASPSFRARLFSLDWVLEARAVIAFGTDVALLIPIEVSARGGEESVPSSRAPRVAPVGKERRALVWAEAAKRGGFDNDAERERMTLDVGEVRIAIHLEHRGDEGMWTIAALTWPSLGADARISERRWVDAFKDDIATDDPAFHGRFTVRGRERRQIEGFVTRAVQRALTAFQSVALDDEGAALASKGSAHSLDELLSFVNHAKEAARAIDEALPLVPFPAQIVADAPAWSAFAETLGGKLRPGRPMITGGTWDREPAEVLLRWEGDGVRTIARVRFPREQAIDESGEEARALRRALESEQATVEVTRELVAASFSGALPDPAALAPTLDRLAMLARALRGERDAGPYR